jgi:hypothetical protein
MKKSASSFLKFLACMLILFSANQALAQKKKAKTKVKTQKFILPKVVEQDVKADKEYLSPPVAERDPSPDGVATDDNSVYTNLSRETINEETEWVRLKGDNYDYKYGINKRGRAILPMAFIRSNSNINEGEKLFPIGIGTNYGLYNIDTEKWNIPMIYSKLEHIGNHVYEATLNGRMGLIDDKNKVILSFNWNYISNLYNVPNYYIVSDAKTNLKGIYSLLKGELVTPCLYKEIETIDSGSLFKVTTDNGCNIISIDNKPKFKIWYNELISSTGRTNYIVKLIDKMGIIDSDEKIILPIEYRSIKSYPYNDGSYLAINEKGKYGCVLIDGKVSLPFEYDFINTDYNNNLKSIKNNKCGLIQVNNGSPTEIVTCNYDNIIVEGGSFIIQKNNKFGLMDAFGKVVSECVYDNLEKVVTDQSNSFLFIANNNKQFDILDKKGKKVNEVTYSKIEKLRYINRTGRYYDDNKYSFLKFTDAKGKVGLLDSFGSEVFKNPYDDIVNWSGNNLNVVSKGKAGIYNMLNKQELIPCQYDQIAIDKTGYYGIKGAEVYLLDLDNAANSKKL